MGSDMLGFYILILSIVIVAIVGALIAGIVQISDRIHVRRIVRRERQEIDRDLFKLFS